MERLRTLLEWVLVLAVAYMFFLAVIAVHILAWKPAAIAAAIGGTVWGVGDYLLRRTGHR